MRGASISGILDLSCHFVLLLWVLTNLVGLGNVVACEKPVEASLVICGATPELSSKRVECGWPIRIRVVRIPSCSVLDLPTTKTPPACPLIPKHLPSGNLIVGMVLPGQKQVTVVLRVFRYDIKLDRI